MFLPVGWWKPAHTGVGSPFGNRLPFGKGAPRRTGEAGFIYRSQRGSGTHRPPQALRERAAPTSPNRPRRRNKGALCAGPPPGAPGTGQAPAQACGQRALRPRARPPGARSLCPTQFSVSHSTPFLQPHAPRTARPVPARPCVLCPPIGPSHQRSGTGPPPPPTLWAARPHPRAARALTSAGTPRGPRRKITGGGDGDARPRSPFAEETA